MDSKEIYDYIIKIQSIAKIGLVYSKDPYAITNYQQINDLSLKMLEEFMEVKFDRPNYFERNIYPTPNVSVRTVIFDKSRTKVLLVREASSRSYSLPGGWADLYDSPSDTAHNECRQEAGAEIEIVRLVGITHKLPLVSGHGVPEYETDDVNFFPIDNLPEISRKTSKQELMRMISAALENRTIFD